MKEWICAKWATASSDHTTGIIFSGIFPNLFVRSNPAFLDSPHPLLNALQYIKAIRDALPRCILRELINDLVSLFLDRSHGDILPRGYSVCRVMFSSTPMLARVTNNDEPP